MFFFVPKCFLLVFEIHKLCFAHPRRRAGNVQVWFVSAFGPPMHNATHTQTTQHTNMLHPHEHTHTQYDIALTLPLHETTRTAPTHPHTHFSFLLPNRPISVVFMMRHDKLQNVVSSQAGNSLLGFASAATGAPGRRKSPIPDTGTS